MVERGRMAGRDTAKNWLLLLKQACASQPDRQFGAGQLQLVQCAACTRAARSHLPSPAGPSHP